VSAVCAPSTLEHIERPAGGRTNSDLWGSDVIAELLRRCDIPYIALVPGSSYHGLQDNLVNQETMARVRGRQVANRRIGQRLDDPPVDLDHLATSFGAVTRR
jgi:hypothetical protein